MKKSVILTILVIYVLSIVAVGLLGIKLAVYDEILYVESIRLVDSEDGAYTIYSYTDNGEEIDLISLPYKQGLSFQLYYEVLPLDATNKDVTFAFDYGEEDSKKEKIEVNQSGVVTVKTINVGDSVIIDGFLIAQDGSKVKSKKVRIYIYNR